jgi:bifunctional non-homologous end joining protein LigD
MALSVYNKKRNFKNTPEPRGIAGKKKFFRFVVQRHDATRLHYDFRLELGGVLKSWAVPKGPSMNSSDRRLAVMVEDHPISYIDFEGEIPKGNYGAGAVQIWDKGVYFPINKDIEKISEKEALLALKNGELKFILKGEKLEGEFVLVRLKDDKNWLLIKHKDEYAVSNKYNSEDYTNASLKKSKVKKKTA